MKPGVLPIPLDVYQGDKFYIPRIEVPTLNSEGGPTTMDGVADVVASIERSNLPFDCTVEIIEDPGPLDAGIMGAVTVTMLSADTVQIPKGEGRFDISVVDEDGEYYTWLQARVIIAKRVREEA